MAGGDCDILSEVSATILLFGRRLQRGGRERGRIDLKERRGERGTDRGVPGHTPAAASPGLVVG